ncbi:MULTISPECIES: hypothetical protein [Pontibacillus]|uniref:Amino acid transporter n=1 Tax=Pontibacillus chungwhensis TaxID=265426 RepID=A0ABY8V5S7_9BACI|nr:MULTISPECIES: hypothetical protein [Pontibacillus]MCD5324500.1 hypothetical protein [Pontibacillus sp. HN14]WIF99206.1 hypothetical protein QNI29_05980 [Pontibacillus chungwhensis]
MNNRSDEENQSFNDVTEHNRTITGLNPKKSGRLPGPIKFIGIFLIGGFILMGILAFILNIITG